MQGKAVIFSAPSGAGKTTIVRHLLTRDLGLEFSISACSREPRKGEVHAQDYYFFSAEAFKRKIEEEAFLEWEEVYTDNFYGTLKSEIERIWSKGKHVIFDVDVIGGLNLKKIFGDQALAIFVQPPSIEELKARLEGRDTETPEKIAQRVHKAKTEVQYAPDFDHVLINDRLSDALDEAFSLVGDFLKP